MHGLDHNEPFFYARPTPPLSPEGVAEVVAEMEAPPLDTPERRATFARARRTEFLVRQALSGGIAATK